MSVFAVTEVKFDESHGRITQARMGAVVTKGAEWMTATRTVDVSLVIRTIKAGDDVFTIFEVDGNYVPGQKLKVVTYPEGMEGIAIDGPETPNMTLLDLPRF